MTPLWLVPLGVATTAAGLLAAAAVKLARQVEELSRLAEFLRTDRAVAAARLGRDPDVPGGRPDRDPRG